MSNLSRTSTLALASAVAATAVLLATAGCRTASIANGPADWETWRAKRLQSVGGSNGWTTLVGLHWLAEGTNPTGSGPSNRVVLPRKRAPEYVGSFLRRGTQIRFYTSPSVTITVSNHPISSLVIQSDADGQATPTTLRVGDLTLLVLQRGERFGVRVRDPEARARKHFRGLPLFPYDPAWRFTARFVAFPEPRALRVPDVIGNTQSLVSPGQLVFELSGREHRLDVVDEPGEEDYFVIFRDSTAGETTYASGRFLYVSRPDATGTTTLDFNRAYNPPCAFTAFATCPLTPPQNRLPFPIRAGERKPAGKHP